jgi:hypothetical protein
MACAERSCGLSVPYCRCRISGVASRPGLAHNYNSAPSNVFGRARRLLMNTGDWGVTSGPIMIYLTASVGEGEPPGPRPPRAGTYGRTWLMGLKLISGPTTHSTWGDHDHSRSARGRGGGRGAPVGGLHQIASSTKSPVEMKQGSHPKGSRSPGRGGRAVPLLVPMGSKAAPGRSFPLSQSFILL